MTVVVLLASSTPSRAATPLAQVDVAAFASRADAWAAARAEHRDEARTRAVELAQEARQAEEDRLAAEEAARRAEQERIAAEAAARTTTTTTVPPTSAPPSTTAAPTTTSPPPTGDGDDTTASTTSPPTTPAPPAGSPTEAQWAVLRQCESSGNYSIVSANGRYRGAYQFSQATWDWIAGLDYPALVGVDPAAAAPADQDAMAVALWQRQGWRPWPICGQQAAAA